MDESLSTSPARAPLLHSLRHAHRTAFNRMFAAVYFCAILVLLHHHALKLIHSTTFASFPISLSFLVSDTFLAFLWFTRQCFLMTIVYRDEYPENLQKTLLLKKSSSNFPALDVFICTADPYKEPPMRLVSTALSVMAYDYPTEKISVYVSDDGGSQVTLFACMEAAKFAYDWLAFCKKNNIIERSPETYFAANHSSWFFDTEEIQKMYESMKQRVEKVLEKGKVGEEYITEELERKAFSKWVDHGFTWQDHPTVIQVLLESCKNKDATNHLMPNLIYVSREKSKTSPHNFKAGALNVMLSEPSFILYVFLVLGAYGQDLLEFMIDEGTVQNWWNDQRMWMIRGLSSFGYGCLEFFLKCLGISTYGFGLTSKVIDNEQSKRYGQGMFEFGASSNMFVPLITAAIVNLVSFLTGLVQVLRGSKMEGLFLQMFLAGFVVLNALPIYEAMVLRNDQGRIPFKTTATSTCLALALYGLVSLPLGNRN